MKRDIVISQNRNAKRCNKKKDEEKKSNCKENMCPVSDFKFNARFYNILMKVDLNVVKKQVIAVFDGTKA